MTEWLDERWTAAIPLVLYFIVFLITWPTQTDPIEDRVHPVLDQAASTSLSLLAFNITVLSLLITLHADRQTLVAEPVRLFSMSTSCFLGSFICLHLRLANAFKFTSETLLTTGIWLLILGARALFQPFPALREGARMLDVAVFVFVIYVIFDVSLKLRAYVKTRGARA